ncbi:MAG: endonuclease domain-containing protein [Cyanothece sp. SIO2G6]|nr:endonuclease domain-containing protein [Cyanothece sp. SIO2G6]
MVEVARSLRQRQTTAEAILWNQFRRKQRGYKVRRQQPIGPFVVDFYVSQARLIIEIDGPIHQHTVERDRQRQSLLEQLGLTVLRFSNQDVEMDLESVLMAVDQVALSPDPSPSAGEGRRI